MIYEYKCTNCKEITEKIQQVKDVGDHPCDCGGTNKRYFGNYSSRNFLGIENINKMFFDSEDRKWYPVLDRDKIGKATGRVWISDKERKEEAKKNKEYHQKKSTEKFEKGLEKDLVTIFNKK